MFKKKSFVYYTLQTIYNHSFLAAITECFVYISISLTVKQIFKNYFNKDVKLFFHQFIVVLVIKILEC